MISAYLLNYETKDDIAYLANNMNFNIPIYDKKEVVSDEEASKRAILKAKFIYTSKKELYNKMKEEDTIYLFENIEMPLARYLLRWKLKVLELIKIF